jgi:antirestriction protein
MNNPERLEGGEHHQQPEPAEQEPANDCRIYAASLSDYNAGRLHGQWINAHQTPEELHDATTAMLAESREPGAEEWAIHDYEGFGPIRLGEYETLDTISTLAEGINEHGSAFAAWVAHIGTDGLEPERFNDAYLGEWKTLEDYAEHVLDDLGFTELITNHAPDHLRHYVNIDSAGFARDLQLSGDVFTTDAEEGGVHVFDAHT